MKILIILMTLFSSLVSGLALGAPVIKAVEQNGTVILQMKENGDEKTFVVTQVLQISGRRDPEDYKNPVAIQSMLEMPLLYQRDTDIDYTMCMPRGLLRGVFNWLSDYVRGELERLLDIRF